jgi:hypothetical protein
MTCGSCSRCGVVKYFCKKCERQAKKEEKLCKPEKLK